MQKQKQHPSSSSPSSASAKEVQVKQELEDFFRRTEERSLKRKINPPPPPPPLSSSLPKNVIELSDSDDDDDGDGDDDVATKKQKLSSVSLPPGFLDPIPPLPESTLLSTPPSALPQIPATRENSKQFWKAGDYEGAPSARWDTFTGGMDHVRVHPKFLHSNATSHKWALGAFAELLDNSLDEVCNGATYVNIDMLINKKDGGNMLLIEDNGGGMDPDKVRQCMSLGYSAKSKLANTIGQYGNGFKTSTMRLGADVIVFTRSCGKDGKSVTQSIGLLAYTFLRCTGKEDIVVPILDYELRGKEWKKMMRSSVDDWNRNVDTIINWSPYSSETELLQQFNLMKDHGTRIVIYNLWEDDQGQMELDFKSDRQDIQIRGVNRDEKNIEMAKEFPNSKHFLTYRHSLRSYASILYLRLPPNFRIILRGKDVEHHNVVNDMMMREEVTYRPQPGADGVPRNADMVAIVTIGFVKDATAHIDVQGFNVYHKNRLIKPFWRVWSAAGSDGRGVIGVLEANFVEPAHDKQGFERTIVLARLESKLVQMQKQYWRNYCHKIGYAPRVNKKQVESGDRESSPEYTPSSSRTRNKGKSVDHENSVSRLSDKHGGKITEKNISLNEKYGGKSTENYVSVNEKYGEKTADKYVSVNEKHGGKTAEKYASVNENGGKTSGKFVSSSEKHRNGRTPNARYRESSEEPSSPSVEEPSDDNEEYRIPRRGVNGNRLSTSKTSGKDQLGKALPIGKTDSIPRQEKDSNGGMDALSPSNSQAWHQLREENRTLKEKLQVLNELKEENRILKDKLQDLERLKKENDTLKERLEGKNEEKLGALERDLEVEREKCKLLETKLHETECKLEDLNKEQESLIDIFSEERDRRDVEEETLRKKIREASNTIEDLRERVVQLDRMNSLHGKR